MATSVRGKISIETGQTLVTYAEMTDSGDHQIYSLGTIWSNKSGFEPSVRPDGMVSGRNVLSISAVNDTITIAGFTAYDFQKITRGRSDISPIQAAISLFLDFVLLFQYILRFMLAMNRD